MSNLTPAPVPTYTLHLARTRADLDAIISVSWLAWFDPYIPATRIAKPIFGYTSADRERAIADSKDRSWTRFEKSMVAGTSVFVFAKHVETGQTVGGLHMNWDEEGSDGTLPEPDIWWWPEGEAREFCREMQRQIGTPRRLWMRRAHGGMYEFVVHPKHRGKGVGKLLLEYNCKELDSRGWEGFVEATESGRRAYERAGYQVVMKIASFVPAEKLDDDDWKRFYHEMGMMPFYAMWRPKGGKIEPGERTKPWQ